MKNSYAAAETASKVWVVVVLPSTGVSDVVVFNNAAAATVFAGRQSAPARIYYRAVRRQGGWDR